MNRTMCFLAMFACSMFLITLMVADVRVESNHVQYMGKATAIYNTRSQWDILRKSLHDTMSVEGWPFFEQPETSSIAFEILQG